MDTDGQCPFNGNRDGGVCTMTKIELTQAQLDMLRDAWHSYAHDFWEEIEQGSDKRRVKTFEAIDNKLYQNRTLKI